MENTLNNKAIEHAGSYKEIVQSLTKKEALEEANRCLQCKEPKCVIGCPAGVNCKEFIRLIKEGKPAEATKEILLKNCAPCVTGRVCQAFKQCEGSCLLAKTGKAINISGLERFAADNSEYGFEKSLKPNKKKIAIIGSGPAGLSAAIDLRKQGYSVKIFEAEKKAGGLLVDAIPKYRLPETTAERFVKQALEAGIEIEFGKRLGDNVSLEQLTKDFDAVLIASGEETAKKLQINGNNLQGVLYWNNFLKEFNGKTGLLAGKKVIVIGGGDTAIDCARVAIRKNADVTIVYRKTKEFMPAQKHEILEASEEEINFLFLLSPLEFIGTGNKLKQAVFEKIVVEREHFVVTNQKEAIDCDIAIVAAGQQASEDITNSTSEKGKDLEFHGNKTNQQKVFVAGDLINKTKTVIHAIRSGKEAAKEIDDFLNDRSNIPEGITKL